MKAAWQHYKETTLKGYFKRIFFEVKVWELGFWWIVRAAMIFAFIHTAFFNAAEGYKGSNPPIQILANLVGMFAYEIIQLFFQNITALGFFLGSFGGAYLNLYYSLPMYDKILHAFGTAEAVYIGYEYICATQLKLKKTAPHQIVNLGALGFGFILSSAWELFEFTYDQFFGGDAQHWNYQAALESAGGDPAKIFNFIPLIGGLLMYAVLVVYPYRHRGENDVNKRIELENASAAALAGTRK